MSSIEWAIRFRDVITGGTLYWLNDKLDGGEVAYQEWCFIDPELFSIDQLEASVRLWRERLQPIGVELFDSAIRELKQGIVRRRPQDVKYSTYEPAIK